jgi:DNA-binding NarL/FixJ family response regulator
VTKVAIVDDHEALREGLARLLEDRGLHVVGSAGTAGAAEDLLHDGEPDVAVIDIRLPDESGIELTKRLLARHPKLGVVLYTGDADAELLFGGLDSGARGYALKTGSMSELVGAIERVAGGGTYVDPRLDRVLLSERSTSRLPQLSPRERQITHLMAEGRTAEAIGSELGVSVETVRTHVRNVIRKLRARNRVHAIAIALERGEIALSSDPTRPQR